MIIQLKEWQNGTTWHAAFVDKFLPHVSNSVLIARALGVPYDVYVKRVIEEFKPDHIQYIEDKGLVFFSWTKQSNMRKYKNQINKELREAGDIQV